MRQDVPPSGNDNDVQHGWPLLLEHETEIRLEIFVGTTFGIAPSGEVFILRRIQGNQYRSSEGKTRTYPEKCGPRRWVSTDGEVDPCHKEGAHDV